MRTKISRMMRGHALPAALVMMSLSTLAGCGMDDAILDDTYIPASYQERHPIRVVEKPVTIAIRASAGGLGPSQMNEVINFANDARMHSKSVISVRVAGGSAAHATSRDVIEVLMAQGIPQSMIRTGAGRSSGLVTLSFKKKVAVTNECGDWSENLASDMRNTDYKNFGCAMQNNVAAMIANPEDIEQPQASTNPTGADRSKAITNYRDGNIPMISVTSGFVQ